MARTRADYREWLRLRLQVRTPLQEWLLARDLGQFHEPLPPPPGAQPSIQQDPTNYVLDNAIARAQDTVNRECYVMDAHSFTDIQVPAMDPTAVGPQTINFLQLPGFTDREPVRIRRAYWFDGLNYNRLLPVNLMQMDQELSMYMSQGPAIPYQYATEGQLLYLIPGTQQAGVLRTSIGGGFMAPLTDQEGFEGIPESYDDCVLYVALLEVAQLMASDNEMAMRAKNFEDEKVRSLIALTNWFDNLSNEEFLPGAYTRPQIPRRYQRN